MYVPNYHQPPNDTAVFALIEQNSFATLISHHRNQFFATHTPIILKQNGDAPPVLFAHISKSNPHKNALTDGAIALAIFQGPHAYVSPSWYTAPNVPTWNYAAAHVTGTVKRLANDELLAAMQGLMEKYENDMPNGGQKMVEIPPDMLAMDLRGIIAFHLIDLKIEAAFKLSQNRDAASYQNITDQLASTGDQAAQATAVLMQLHQPEHLK